MKELWQQIWATLVAEFSDVWSVQEISVIIIRLTVAAVLGGALGYERASRGKSAGLRTHMLVAIGSAIFILVPKQAGATDADLARVIQGLVAGVGFLGAGNIIKSRSELEIRGLTTAATIWLAAAIGMAAGMGREGTALLSTVLAIAILAIVPNWHSVHETDAQESRST